MKRIKPGPHVPTAAEALQDALIALNPNLCPEVFRMVAEAGFSDQTRLVKTWGAVFHAALNRHPEYVKHANINPETLD